MAENLIHACKNCGSTGPVANSERRGFMDALGGTGVHMRTTVECSNCGYWNWHVAPSGSGDSQEAWHARQSAKNDAADRERIIDRQRAIREYREG